MMKLLKVADWPCAVTQLLSEKITVVSGVFDKSLTTPVICLVGRGPHNDVKVHSMSVRFGYEQLVMEI